MMGLNSCEKTEISEGISDKDKEVIKELLELKAGMGDLKSDDNIYSNSSSFKKSFASMKVKTYKSSFKGDSTNWEDWSDYVTCATVTESVDAQGNFVSVYDYGTDGCEEYGELIRGKITYIWSESDDEGVYYSKVIYDDYYAYEMLMNGYSEYSFTMSDFDPLNWNFSGTATCTDDISMIFDDGSDYTYNGTYSDKWDETSYTVLEGNYSYRSNSDDYEFSYKVTKELVYNYSCDTESEWIYVPVSGIEVIKYTEDGETGEFSIDYGDGSCDNLAIITKDGVSEEIDFSDYWDEIWCDDNTAECDSI